MRISFKRTTIIFVVLALVAAPLCAMAADELQPRRDRDVAAGAMICDAIIARPLGLVSTALGFGMFIISSPFSALGGNIGDAWTTLVAHPAKFTFVRPLGDFDGIGGP